MPESTFSLKRVLSPKPLEMVQKQMKFFLEQIQKSDGELDLQIRNNYFNVYYKGNSLVKVRPYPSKKTFEFVVNRAFGLKETIKKLEHPHLSVPELFKKDKNDDITDNIEEYKKDDAVDRVEQSKNSYDIAYVPASKVRSFFQTSVVEKLKSQIRKRNYGEEIAFEQSLITDNLGRQDFIIIDRQIQMQGQRRKMDLLALQQQSSGNYRFLVIEVKLGNNKELSGAVAQQIKTYVNLVEKHFSKFKETYEENYRQKRLLGVLGASSWPRCIEIEEPVEAGRIVVGLYSGIGNKQIIKLLAKHPNLCDQIDRFWNILPNRSKLE